MDEEAEKKNFELLKKRFKQRKIVQSDDKDVPSQVVSKLFAK